MKYSIAIFTAALGLTFCSLFTNCQKSADARPANELQQSAPQAKSAFMPDQQWNDYWYKGLAELTSYTLQQSRYGEIHSGTVVNIFVTEDFSRTKQVKLDDSRNAGDDKVNVLKLNQSVKFNTGIYPYSLMMSAFSPVDMQQFPHALKIAATMQEWCGMTYFQLNNRADKYTIEQRSYFESEGDKDVNLSNDIVLEDEVWTHIRMQPATLPLGEIKIFPGALYLRLSHKPIEAVDAKASLRNAEGMKIYQIDYPSLNRTLSITFEPVFPYKITGWEDTYPGLDGKLLTTVASKNKELMVDYWSKHTNADSLLRKELGLPVLFQ